MVQCIRVLALATITLPFAALSSGAMAQNGSGIDVPGVNCSMPGSYCSSTTTTVTIGSDGRTSSTEKKTTIGGQPVDGEDAPKARRVIQPKRDDSAMPGMHFDPALGYYVPN